MIPLEVTLTGHMTMNINKIIINSVWHRPVVVGALHYF